MSIVNNPASSLEAKFQLHSDNLLAEITVLPLTASIHTCLSYVRQNVPTQSLPPKPPDYAVSNPLLPLKPPNMNHLMSPPLPKPPDHDFQLKQGKFQVTRASSVLPPPPKPPDRDHILMVLQGFVTLTFPKLTGLRSLYRNRYSATSSVHESLSILSQFVVLDVFDSDLDTMLSIVLSTGQLVNARYVLDTCYAESIHVTSLTLVDMASIVCIWDIIILGYNRVKQFENSKKICIEVEMLGISPNSIVLTWVLITYCFKNIIGNKIGVIVQHIFDSNFHLMLLPYEPIKVTIWMIGDWFVSTNLHFGVADTNHSNSRESSYSVTYLSQTSWYMVHRVLSGSPQTNMGAYKIFWLSIRGDKCFGVDMLTNLDMTTHYGVDELFGSLSEATVNFLNATKKNIIIMVFSILQSFMGMALHLRHIENHLCGVSMCKIFLKSLNKRFLSIALSPQNCALILCTLRAGSSIMEPNLEDLDFLNYSLDYFQALLFGNNNVCEVLERLLYLHEKLLAWVSFAIDFAKSFIANHFLNILYQMHPTTHSFPSSPPHLNQIFDLALVKVVYFEAAVYVMSLTKVDSYVKLVIVRPLFLKILSSWPSCQTCKKWDPDGDGYYFLAEGSLQSKQWDPGGCCLVNWVSLLDWRSIGWILLFSNN
jgi:hypothetical protein